MRFRITTTVAPILDPGWLFLLAGVTIIGATMLIPAADDLAEARWQRERALTQERRRQERLENYQRYLDALERGNPRLALSLAASELNMIPVDRDPLPGMPRGMADSATIFNALEPPPIIWAERPLPDSILYRWTTNDAKRLWLIAGGALACFCGLLPASRPRRELDASGSGAGSRSGRRAGAQVETKPDVGGGAASRRRPSNNAA
ncbi:MAG: hypothetical protein KF902_14695 [Phycisphaeraceae bacterium]|nr:hypothetical protein [Phycisphaeraceae bacterium]MCW5768541.1 hypothetical protein [Phycisphaeraceae bacterium]